MCQLCVVCEALTQEGCQIIKLANCISLCLRALVVPVLNHEAPGFHKIQ